MAMEHGHGECMDFTRVRKSWTWSMWRDIYVCIYGRWNVVACACRSKDWVTWSTFHWYTERMYYLLLLAPYSNGKQAAARLCRQASGSVLEQSNRAHAALK